jgi:alanine racemase
MDVVAVETPERVETGTPVTLIGDGLVVEEHARVAETIAYEIVCGLNRRAPRAESVVTGG